MRAKLERNSEGRMVLRKGARGGDARKKMVAVGLALAMAAIAVTGIQTAIAGGDQNMHNHGEDGYYEENNCNSFDDDDFPGLDTQNRTGV
ncbi:TPA: hypothetical protein HA259_00405 [Thermoplasmata archaeon]|nr:hypothetical protein [Thermoplasmata archaeon]